MTLHWWMHWFWVTLLLLHGSVAQAAPQTIDLQNITTDLDEHPITDHNERQGRAMYFTKTLAPPIKSPNVTETTEINIEVNNTIEPHLELTLTDVLPPVNWTQVNATEVNVTATIVASNDSAINATVLQDSDNTTLTVSKKRNNLTRPEVKDIDSSIESAAESRIVTEKPLSLETTFLQTRIPPNIESSRRVIDIDEPKRGMDTGEIAGISFGALVLAALAGSTAFVLYRRRYLNKPQTLNDKCSNPDSSGYLDDSTIRDNSEEMYSLDNDSFLNSLEAMTIQNYWTDTVKHTKL